MDISVLHVIVQLLKRLTGIVWWLTALSPFSPQSAICSPFAVLFAAGCCRLLVNMYRSVRASK